MTANMLIKRFEQFAPPALAMPHDPVGLHFGNPDRKVKKVMVTLDVRPEVVEEAIAKDVDMIFSHHPPIFRPIKSFDTTIPQNQMYANIIKHDIVIYAAHTNLDLAEGGMNDWLCDALGLEAVEPLSQESIAGKQQPGLGRIGNLRKAMPLSDLFDRVKEAFQIAHFRYVADDIKQDVQRVAVIGGDGGDYYQQALAKGADVFITGDVYYHTAHDMQAAHLAVIDPGHHIESIVKPRLQALFSDWAEASDWEVSVIASELHTDPFKFR